MRRAPKVHGLKTWPAYFEAVRKGRKTFEVRLDDRGFRRGDFLHLQEYDPKTSRYSGRTLTALVRYILRKGFGLQPGYVVMAIRKEPNVEG